MSAPVTTATAPAGASAAGIAWQRRRHAFTDFARQFAKNRAGLVGLVVLVLAIVVALTAPLYISQNDLSAINAPGEPLQAPGSHFLLGTDYYGRSMVDVMIWGTRVSLTVGFLAAFMSVGIGAVIGLIAGHFGGWLSTLLMRATDWFLVLPTLVLAMALASVLNGGTATVILAIGVTSWPSTARLVRSQTLTVEARPYIERSRALGAGHTHVILRHVLPNTMPLVLANTTIMVANAVVGEATLAFLGLEDPTRLSWGTTLQLAKSSGAVSAGDWWNLLPPGIAIAVVALAFTVCGRAIEQVLNPRLRSR